MSGHLGVQWAPRRQEDYSDERRRLFRNLFSALLAPSGEKEPTLKTFAACGAVKYSEGFILKSFHVEGAGELRLPLSSKDISTLRGVCEQAPVVDSSGPSCSQEEEDEEDEEEKELRSQLSCCLQVDAFKVAFPGAPDFISNIIQPLAIKAVGALGLDGAAGQLQAHLSKVLFYEAGGQYTFHRDTNTGKGTFAKLLLQLPTDEGYTGGKLVVKHFDAVKEFDCHLGG